VLALLSLKLFDFALKLTKMLLSIYMLVDVALDKDRKPASGKHSKQYDWHIKSPLLLKRDGQ
jgi:hypothetical protein